MFKVIIHFLFFLVLFENTSFAQQSECMGSQSETLDKNNSTLTSCDTAKIALFNDVKGDIEYRNKLNAKLAKSVASQAKQILEDLGANSKFYEQNDDDFLLSSEVSEQCKFEYIKEIERKGCNQKSSTPEEKEKIKMLNDALTINGDRSRNLFDSLSSIYATNKYGVSNRSCPLDESDLPLQTIMISPIVSKFIENLKLEKNSAELGSYYKQYPQLDMIIRADIVSPGFKDKFENYMKAFDPNKNSAKEYFSRFFGLVENKKILGSGVASQCRQMQSSITSFVCHDVKNPISKDGAISKKLFNGYNPNKEYQDQKSTVKNDPDSFKTYAYLCIEKQQSGEVRDDTAKLNLEKTCGNLKISPFDNVDHWYRCFNFGTRVEQDKIIQSESVKKFCALYSCESPDVKKLSSCISGGPLSSADLFSIAKADDILITDAEYIAQFEKNKKQRAIIIARSEAVAGKSTVEIKKSISSFDLNAFGGDAVSKFLDLPETPKVAAVIQTEMKEKGIEPQTHEQIQKIVSREDRPTEAPSFNQQTQLASNDFFAPPVQQASTGNYTHDLKNSFNSFESTKSEKINNKEESNTRSNQAASINDETEKMKKDLQDLMDARPSSSGNTEEAAPKEEKRKNDFSGRGYTDELRDWSSDLRRKESELSAREIAQWNRDREQNFRQSELDNRERELFERFNDPKEAKAKATAAPVANMAADKKTSINSAEARLNKEREELQVKTNGLTVSPEKLEQLEKKDLTDLGVNIEEPFIIRVVMKGKSIPVRVSKMKKSNGKTYLAPYLNEDSKEIKEAILRSPIFKEFRYYLDQHLSPYSPLKKGKN